MSRRLEVAEAAAFAEIATATRRPLLRLGGTLCRVNLSEPDDATLNRVIALGVEGPVTPEALDEIAAFFEQSGSKRHSVSVAPDADPELPEKLEARGYVRGDTWTRFCRDVAAAAPAETELRVEPATDPDMFARVFAAGFEQPEPGPGEGLGPLVGREGWHPFLAFDGATPAAVGLLFAHDGVGWFGGGATPPEHRRKGAQNALLAARIECARKLGLDVLTVETTEHEPDHPGNSVRNLLRAGFVELYARPNWLSPQ
jgi:GNAT superfamily N-acetyltransferase